MPFLALFIAFYFLRVIAWAVNKVYGLPRYSDYKRWAGNPPPKVRRAPRRN